MNKEAKEKGSKRKDIQIGKGKKIRDKQETPGLIGKGKNVNSNHYEESKRKRGKKGRKKKDIQIGKGKQIRDKQKAL